MSERKGVVGGPCSNPPTQLLVICNVLPHQGWTAGNIPGRSSRSSEFWYAKISVFMEHSFACPHCGEEISMVLDLSVSKQTYVEDCEVCCNPIEISYTVSDEELAEFSARTSG